MSQRPNTPESRSSGGYEFPGQETEGEAILLRAHLDALPAQGAVLPSHIDPLHLFVDRVMVHGADPETDPAFRAFVRILM